MGARHGSSVDRDLKSTLDRRFAEEVLFKRMIDLKIEGIRN
jgi:hypothetical protein